MPAQRAVPEGGPFPSEGKAKHPLGRGALSVRFAVFPQAHAHVMSRQFFVVCRQHWDLQASDQREALAALDAARNDLNSRA